MDKIQIIEKLFSYILIFSFLLFPIIALIRKKLEIKLVPILFLYGLIYFLDLLLGYINLLTYTGFHSKVHQSVYTFFEFVFLSSIFWHQSQSKKYRLVLIAMGIAFFVFQIIFLFTGTLGRIDSVPIGVESIILFIFSFYYFHQIFSNTKEAYIYQDPYFLFVIGILVYLGFSFFFNILANHLSDELIQYWYLTYIPEIIKNILFAIAIYKFPDVSKQKNNTSSSVPFLDMH